MQRRACFSLLGLPWAGSALAGHALRVAWDHYPPYQRPPRAPGGRPQGLDIELAERIAARAGLAIDWRHMPWARQLVALREGSLDVALAASRVAERESYVLWTHAYRPERAALLALQAAAQPYPSLRALRGRRIGLIRGSAYPGEWDQALADPGFRAQIVPLRHAEQGVNMLRAGRLDFLVDDPVALHALCQDLGLPRLAVQRWIWSGEAALMLSRRIEASHPGLLRRLNQAIRSLQAEGGLRELLGRYPELLVR
jgi:polar amino acid transport system substrate-binding protein